MLGWKRHEREDVILHVRQVARLSERSYWSARTFSAASTSLRCFLSAAGADSAPLWSLTRESNDSVELRLTELLQCGVGKIFQGDRTVYRPAVASPLKGLIVLYADSTLSLEQ